jgi:peroxiredoxin family protein
MWEDKETDRKLCIICSKGTLDMAYPGLVLANAALMEGIDVTIFFTFWGLDMITKKEMANLKFTPIGNPHKMNFGSRTVGIPNAVAGFPGMTNMATSMIKKEMTKLEFPEIPEFLEMIVDAGGKLYACRLSTDMFQLQEDDLYDGVVGIVGATDFMEMSENAQIIFI